MIRYQHCTNCKSTEIEEKFQCVDFYYSKKSFPIFKCNTCGLEFTNDIPNEEEISEYYQSENYISHNNEKGIFGKIYKFLQHRNFNHKYLSINRFKNSGNLLDIGCGNGAFLKLMKEKGFNVSGLEPSDFARELVKNNNIQVHKPDYINSLKDNSYDVITLWHVYEHIHNLDELDLQINRILKSDGILVIAVPLCNSYDAQKYKQHWAGYDVPRHLYHFTPKQLNERLAKKGYSQLDQIPLIFDSYYVSLLSEKYKNSFLYPMKGLLFGLISNFKATTSKQYNYSSEIFIYKKSNP